MSEIKDKVDKQIIHILDVWHNFSKEDTEDIKWRRYFIDQILSIKELTIVDREVKLPKLLEFYKDDIGEAGKMGYIKGRQDLIKEGWVKEIKD